MKKVLIILTVAALFSCNKEEKTKNVAEECKCGVIQQTIFQYDNGATSEQTIIYNNCSSKDTTINYIPETSAGHKKEEGEPHCLGVAW